MNCLYFIYLFKEQILNHLQKNNCIQFTAATFFNLDFKLLHNVSIIKLLRITKKIIIL